MHSPNSHIVELYVADQYAKEIGAPVFMPVGLYRDHDGTVFSGPMELFGFVAARQG